MPDFNLDTFEREGAVKPFEVELGGVTYVLPDTMDFDYRDTMKILEASVNGNFEQGLRLLLDEDEREPFFANKLPAWKLAELFTRYKAHYGVSEEATGEAEGSSPS